MTPDPRSSLAALAQRMRESVVCARVRARGSAVSKEAAIAELAKANEAEYWADLIDAALAAQPAPTPEALDVEGMRANLHATFNGGHHDEPARSAFHHGMDTVCNVLAAQQKGEESNGILPAPALDVALAAAASSVAEPPDLDLRFFHARTSVAALAVAARDWRDRALKAEAELAAERQARETLEQAVADLWNGVDGYLGHLNDMSLRLDDTFGDRKSRVVTLACKVRALLRGAGEK